MLRKFLFMSIAVFAFAGLGLAQTSWLDRPMGRNWNAGDGNVPQAPRVLVAISERCREQIRTPDSLADRAVTRAGWSLFGASQTFGQVTVVAGMASTDGMCRPTIYNYFVFVNNRFAGTLSPDAMNSRTDASLMEVELRSETAITGEFARYRTSDALCCPSQRSVVNYRINRERNVVDARSVNTVASCPDGGDISTQDSVVSGTVTYRPQRPLPANAVLLVRVVDVSRQGGSADTLAEDRIDVGGRQAPFSFDLAYEPNRVQERNRYAIQAEIRDGERLLYTTDTSVPVITQGNPRSVEITLVSVGGGGGFGNRQNVIRGSLTYRQRIALGANSEARVWLVDSGDPNGRPVAETTVQFGNRQVPIDFELPYEMRDINRQRSYEVWAEIRTGGQVRFRTERGTAVTLRGNQTENVELVLVPSRPVVEPITGQNFDLSKLGAGSLQVQGGSTMFLIGANVDVRSNGDATVRLSRLGGSVMFSGKLTFFDAGTMRITVESSGNANASGEIEVRYNGRSLGAITSRDLVLDGQFGTVRF
jgi:uncharacterized lipoprotein YbaY